MRIAFATLLLLTTVSWSRADVQWRQDRVEISPEVGAKDTEAVFEFINTGPNPVQVSEVRAGCGCTVALLDQEIVPPGGTGRVRAQYHVGDRRGKQTVPVFVTTADPEKREHILTLSVDIQEFASLSPRLVYWRVGEDLNAKPVRLVMLDGYKVLKTSVSSDRFSVQPGDQAEREVHLVLTPKDTRAKQSATLTVTLQKEQEEPVEVTAILRVI